MLTPRKAFNPLKSFHFFHKNYTPKAVKALLPKVMKDSDIFASINHR